MKIAKRALLGEAVDRLGIAGLTLRLRAAALYPRRYLTILTFHRVAEPGMTVGFDPEVIDTTPTDFDRQMAVLERWFTFIDTRDLEAYLGGQPLPPNPAMVTFDDGYRDNFDNALPILLRHRAKATFFVATRFVGERRIFWWERIHHMIQKASVARLQLVYPEPMDLPLGTAPERTRAARRLLRVIKDHAGLDIDRFLAESSAACRVEWDPAEERRLADAMLMTWDHVRGLRDAGMDVQSHTHAHRILSTITTAETEADLTLARRTLEEQLNTPVRSVAYPAGKKVPDAVREAVVRAGYKMGFTSSTGVVSLDAPVDALEVPRLSTSREYSRSFFRACLAFPSIAY